MSWGSFEDGFENPDLMESLKHASIGLWSDGTVKQPDNKIFKARGKWTLVKIAAQSYYKRPRPSDRHHYLHHNYLNTNTLHGPPKVFHPHYIYNNRTAYITLRKCSSSPTLHPFLFTDHCLKKQEAFPLNKTCHWSTYFTDITVRGL